MIKPFIIQIKDNAYLLIEHNTETEEVRLTTRFYKENYAIMLTEQTISLLGDWIDKNIKHEYSKERRYCPKCGDFLKYLHDYNVLVCTNIDCTYQQEKED